MLQVKDPAIKLFGKTIPFSSTLAVVDSDEFCSGSSSYGSEIGVKEVDKVSEVQTVKATKQQGEDESVNGSNMHEINDENKRIASVDDEIVNANSGSSNVTVEGNSKERTPLKKPDKVLPCPRCDSMDTKFCYYNNYNVLQPRHFCKGCQRYWTAGGAMRNVPVGAGRRKSKNAAFQNRYLTISEVLHASGAGSSNGLVPCPPGLKCGLGFVSNVTQVPFSDAARNTSLKVDEQVVTKSHRSGEINSNGSCVTASNENEITHGHTPLAPTLGDNVTQIPCIRTWPYPWNAAVPQPAFPRPGFTIPFVPPNYWPCTTIPNTWNAPWMASQSQSESSTNSKPSVLGKHPRDSGMLSKNKSEKPETANQPIILTPKALRIDHPEEAAKSSIWETLGIKNETVSKGVFRDLKSEGGKIKHAPENYSHLTSNPAALSRSLNFQEVS